MPSRDDIVGYRFDRIGAVFPSDNAVARYLVVVSMSLNDVLAATKRLLEGLESDAPPHENVYAMRLAGSHIWEMLKFLSQTEEEWPEIAKFVEELPEDAVRDYRSALGRLAEDGSFKGALARLRDHSLITRSWTERSTTRDEKN